jgi:hypothetical protein
MIKKILFCAVLLLIENYAVQATILYAAPCYGTNMPAKGKLSVGAQVHSIENRKLSDDYGKVASTQYFYTMSYGVFDWFSLDGKIGVGDVTYKPSLGQPKTAFPANFAGGYGFRFKPYRNIEQKIDVVCGFQHISVHPTQRQVNGTTNYAILDDWQVSALISKGVDRFTPYAGGRLTRLDLIRRISGLERVRERSDVRLLPVIGTDFNMTQSSFINAEVRFIDETSFSIGFTHNF